MDDMLSMVMSRLVAAFVAAANAIKTGQSTYMPTLTGAKHIPSRADAGAARQVKTVITGLTVVIAASLAVIVVDRFDSSLGTPSSSALSTANNDVLQGFADMVSLIGPLLLVLIAVVIIGVVQRIRG